MSQLSIAEVQSFQELEVWNVIKKRLMARLDVLDHEIEDPNPYQHGVAVGERRAIKMVLSMVDILTIEASGKSPYGRE